MDNDIERVAELYAAVCPGLIGYPTVLGGNRADAGQDGLWTEEAYWGRWWILEVDGERFTVMARCYDTCTKDDLDTMSAMAESIHFLPR